MHTNTNTSPMPRPAPAWTRIRPISNPVKQIVRVLTGRA